MLIQTGRQQFKGMSQENSSMHSKKQLFDKHKGKSQKIISKEPKGIKRILPEKEEIDRNEFLFPQKKWAESKKSDDDSEFS